MTTTLARFFVAANNVRRMYLQTTLVVEFGACLPLFADSRWWSWFNTSLTASSKVASTSPGSPKGPAYEAKA